MNTGSVGQVAVAVEALPDGPLACVHLAGDIDATAEPALANAVHQLYAVAPNTVLVDLAGVTFAWSTLASFLMRVRSVVPQDASLVLCRATSTTRRVLELPGLDLVATMRDDLPPQWDHPRSERVEWPASSAPSAAQTSDAVRTRMGPVARWIAVVVRLVSNRVPDATTSVPRSTSVIT